MTEVVAEFGTLAEATNTASHDKAARQAEIKAALNNHGLEMVSAIVRGAPKMEAAHVIVDTRTGRDIEMGRRRYGAAPSDYVGGWREFTHEGRTKLVKVSADYPVARPDGTFSSTEGFVEVGIAEPRHIGATKMAGKEQRIRVAIDQKGAPHVSGKKDALSFDVDYPNSATMEADFGIAQRMFETASAGLMALEASMPVEQPALPAAPTV